MPGLSYWFYTGLNFWLTVQFGDSPDPGFGVSFNLGSALNLYFGYPAKVIVLGINPIAIAALIYLLTKYPSPKQPLAEKVINPT